MATDHAGLTSIHRRDDPARVVVETRLGDQGQLSVENDPGGTGRDCRGCGVWADPAPDPIPGDHR